MDQRHFPTIIVGGGIAGLYLATKLPAALLLERRMKVGGRVRTVRTEEGMYEAGPWRVHESHKNMLSLLKEYGLTVKPNTSSTITSQQPPEDDPAVTGFSQHDVRILHHGAEYARKKDVLSGYEGLAVAASDANVYHANRHVAGTYHYIVEGFSALVENMAKACEGRVRTAHLVTDIRREGGVYHVCLQGKDTLTCDEIFCCVPPRFIDEWPSVREWVAPQAACVRTAPLHHIYATLKDGTPLSPTHYHTTSALGQVISGENRWFQASYTSGATAEFWNRLALQDPTRFKDLVRGMVKEKLGMDVASVQGHFWKDGVHYWVPVYKTPTQDLVERAVEPHPVALPKFYVAGEAFSGTQGWCEGALQTAKAALDRRGSTPVLQSRLPQGQYVSYQGRIVDVCEWMEVHPGSKAVIEKFLGKDMTSVFRLVDHSKHAYATVFGLQRGFLRVEV